VEQCRDGQASLRDLVQGPIVSAVVQRPDCHRGHHGNPDLKPEKAQTVETEWSWIINRNLIASINGYYTQVQDQVKFVRAGANSVASNLASSSTLGTEGSLRWQWEFLRGFVNGACSRRRPPAARRIRSSSRRTRAPSCFPR